MSRHAFFLGINNSLWAVGKNYTGNLGVGYASLATDPLVVAKPLKPEGVPNWEMSKLTSVHSQNLDVTNQLGYHATFFVYDGNLFYSGVPVEGKTNPLFNGTLNSNKFAPISQDSILGSELTTSLTTNS